MLNEKKTPIEYLYKILSGLKPHISLIRLAVNPEEIQRAIGLGKAIKKEGFDVAFNLMYMSKYYRDDNFLKQLEQLNGLAEYVNVVDSYGGMLPTQAKTLIDNVKRHCSAKIGFHGHNNMELAFANALAAMDAGCDIVDATVLGMGRGAGNLKTELLLTYMASSGLADFDFNILSGLIEEWIPLHEKHDWGTNLPYMVSGANSLPQKDVMEWVTQRFYSFNSIIRALNNQKHKEQDNFRLPVFKPEKTYKNVVIVGGGPKAMLHEKAIKTFIHKLEDVCIVHASSKNAKSFEEIESEQFYCLVGNEGHRLERIFNDFIAFKGKCVLPPFPRKMGTYLPEKIHKSSFELQKVSFTNKYQDAHTALALQIALDLKAITVYVAGYDGYDKQHITPREQGLISENEYLFKKAKTGTQIFAITHTNYDLDMKAVYSII